MIPDKVQALFDFIDYLDSNKKEWITTYIPLCEELNKLDKKKNELKPRNNYKDKQEYDIIQKKILEKFEPIKSNILNSVQNKLRNLAIWNGDDTYSSIWNNNISAIRELNENFTEKDIATIMQYKQKYLSFREETNTDFLCLTFVFQSMDEVLKLLFDFFKDTGKNEFEKFEAKSIAVNSVEEVARGLIENKGKNVQFSIPNHVIRSKPMQEKTNTINIKNEINMGDTINIRDISKNNGQIAIGNGNKIEGGKEVISEMQKKPVNKKIDWQKWGAIATIIGIVVAIALAIIFRN